MTAIYNSKLVYEESNMTSLEKDIKEMQNALDQTVIKIDTSCKDMHSGVALRASALSSNLNKLVKLWKVNPQTDIKNKLIAIAEQIQKDIDTKDFSDSTILMRKIQTFFKS